MVEGGAGEGGGGEVRISRDVERKVRENEGGVRFRLKEERLAAS